MNNNNSIVEKRHDCLGCRLVSGFGVIGIGFYIYSQAKYSKRSISRNSMYTIAAGIFFLFS